MIKAYALLVALIGVILVIGGGQLLLLGGSFYYFASGVALVITALLLWRKRRAGATLYGAFFVVTVLWAAWECGADGWALVPRLAAPAVLGLFLLLPAVRRGLNGESGGTFGRGALYWATAIAVAAGLGTGLHAMRDIEPDPILQAGIDASGGQMATRANAVTDDWPNYGGDAGGSRFSGLAQLTTANVSKLKPAWTYRMGGIHLGDRYSLQATPLKIGDKLYVCSADNDVIAIDAETGKQIWRFDAQSDLRGLGSAACRGVAFFRTPNASGACADRIITNTVDARLIALDAGTGIPCPGFGKNGQVSLLDGMGQVTKGYYYVSSPPAIVRDKVVLGGWVSDNQYWGEPSGVIRAFDAVTGAFAWAFDMGRPDRAGQPAPGEAYTRSTPNSWAPMSADPELGLVYAPTGNPTPDYYGAQRRPFDDHYSSSVVALDAETGRIRWSFQTTHHDLWDYDVPSQPTLADIPGPNGVQRILVQATKRGELFVLDRTNGRPVATVNEHEVPQAGAAPGERVSRTQPFSDGMPSTRGPELTESMMWGVTPLDQLWCRIEFRKSNYAGTLTPPGVNKNTIVYPGYVGGSNWGSVSIDRDRGILVTNSLRLANRLELITRKRANAMGIQPLSTEQSHFGLGVTAAQARTPFAALVSPFLSPLGVPCQQPPYGMISGIDLRSHKLIWTRRLGTAQDSGPMGLPSMLPIPMGVPNIGGSITTRGGLTFIGASHDRYLRAFETKTGRLLWQERLPAGGQATPMTYSGKGGRQFVVIAAGGNSAIASMKGDYIVAFALPK